MKNDVFREVSSLSQQRAVLNLSLLTPLRRGKGYMIFEKNKKVFEKGFEEALNDILGSDIKEHIKRAPLVRLPTLGAHRLCIFK